MFVQSASVRKVFTDLTATTGGVCCLLDTETDVFDICWLNGETFSGETVPGARFSRFHDLVAAWREPVEDSAGRTGDDGTKPVPAPATTDDRPRIESGSSAVDDLGSCGGRSHG
ncbi:hypothetical protein [Kitasatospora sp. NPDC051914]|uniref:hypothetical protein n=1 Tax=Kitasatospora sp. NPDC051914 TaxID=3154945 RepID=UPI003442757E